MNIYFLLTFILLIFVVCFVDDYMKNQQIDRVVYFGPPAELKGKTLNIIKLEVLPHGFQNTLHITAEGGYKFGVYCGDPIKKEAWKEILCLIRSCESGKVIIVAMNNVMWDVDILLTKHGKQFRLVDWIKENNLDYKR